MTVIIDALPQGYEAFYRRSVAGLVGRASMYFADEHTDSGIHERSEADEHTAQALLEMQWQHPGE